MTRYPSPSWKRSTRLDSKFSSSPPLAKSKGVIMKTRKRKKKRKKKWKKKWKKKRKTMMKRMTTNTLTPFNPNRNRLMNNETATPTPL